MLILRWAVDVGRWSPAEAEYQWLLSVLPAQDRLDCAKYLHAADRYRAVVSRLLQQKCVCVCLGIDVGQVKLHRTPARKPFCVNKFPSDLPNFNYNVSHEGSYVVLASEPLCICGVDVAAPNQLLRGRQMTLEAAMQPFRKELSDHEWQHILSFAPDGRRMEAAFQRFWCLKEAFIKARGDGLGFQPLSRAEFRFPEGDGAFTSADLYLDGELQTRWTFSLQQLAGGHWVAVARGPPDAMWDPYGEIRRTFHKPTPSKGELQAHLEANRPPFTLLSVEDLVPEHLLGSYYSTLAC